MTLVRTTTGDVLWVVREHVQDGGGRRLLCTYTRADAERTARWLEDDDTLGAIDVPVLIEVFEDEIAG